MGRRGWSRLLASVALVGAAASAPARADSPDRAGSPDRPDSGEAEVDEETEREGAREAGEAADPSDGGPSGAADDGCVMVCVPELVVEPALRIDDAFGGPRIRDLDTGEIRRLGPDPASEAAIAIEIPTELPGISLSFETLFAPFDHANALAFELETHVTVLMERWTGGWLGGHVDLVDRISPARQPHKEPAYTHKLNLELDLTFHPFARLDPGRWLHRTQLEVSLDYIATGLPERGDVVDGRQYLGDASGWSLAFRLVVPIAPLDR